MAELYSLPDGWEWVEFSKIFDTPTSKPYQIQKTEYLESGLLPIIDQGKEFIIGYTNSIEKKYLNESNCIIFGDHTRQIKYVDFDFVIGADGTKILKEKDKNKYDLKFLYFQFLSKKIESLGYSRHFKLVKEMFFAIPPLEEQKRIVAKLDILFAKIDKAIALHQKNIDEADIFMASVLTDVFVELKEKYEKYRLEDLTSLITKGTTPTTNGYKFQDSGINFLKIENIVNGEIDLSTIEMFISEEAHQSQKRSQLEINDVLFSIAGTIGDTAIVKKEHLPMNTNQAIALIRPIEKLNSEFLRRLLSSSISNETTNKQRGGAIKNVSLGDIKELELPLPPLETQQKIVAYLDEISQKIEKIKQIQKEKMQSLKELKASILDKAFKGEL